MSPTAPPPTAAGRQDAMATGPARRGQRQLLLRWLATFVGYPLGGFAAKVVVGPVDSRAAALIGGALGGAILGGVQAVALRRVGVPPWRWTVATALGAMIGLGVAAAAVGYRTDLASLAVQGAICGAVLGTAQAGVLRRPLGALAALWPGLLAGAWSLGWTITSLAGIDVEAQYTVFGSSGAVVVTALTALLPVALHRRRRVIGPSR